MASWIIENSIMRAGIQPRITKPNICATFIKYYTWNSKLSKLSGADQGPFYISGSDVKPVRLAYVSYENRFPPLKSNAPPIIIMHDIMDSKCHWVPVAQELHVRSLRKVFTVDMRNHGESHQASPMTYVHISEDIKKFMDEFDIETACLIGHGMGGRAAMALALRYPHSVDRLAIIDASPNTTSAYHIQMSKYLPAVRKLRLGSETSMVEARRSVERQLAQVVTEDIARYILTQNLIQTDNDGKICFCWRVNLKSIYANLFNISTFPTIRGRPFCNRPALFIHGANEDRITRKECGIIRRHFPNSEFAQISRSGCFVQTQNPSELVSLVMGFLTI